MQLYHACRLFASPSELLYMTSIKHSDVNAIKCAALSNEMMMMSSFVRDRERAGEVHTGNGFLSEWCLEIWIVIVRDRWFY